ncbi:MAG: deoxynucleoside kinase [Oscillochloridaceae bacterium umkhey_bin13]
MSTVTAGPFHLTVAGNIGVGKSTLVRLLADTLGWTPYYEIAEDHPYLDDFYADPARWGFHSQIWFLAQRHEQHQAIVAAPSPVCQDRSIYEDYEVFVKGLYDQGMLSPRDFGTYSKLFATLVSGLRPPDLLIYLRASLPTLRERINGRARTYEQEIPSAYLESLERRYSRWIANFHACPVLTITTDELDLANNPADRAAVVEQVREVWAQSQRKRSPRPLSMQYAQV